MEDKNKNSRSELEYECSKMYGTLLDEIKIARFNVNPGDVHRVLRLIRGDTIIEFNDGENILINYEYDLGPYKIKYDNPDLTLKQWGEEFGNRLKWLLKREKVTEQYLADELKVNVRTIKRYIKGDFIPSAYMLDGICDVLKIKLDDLLLIHEYLRCVDSSDELSIIQSQYVY